MIEKKELYSAFCSRCKKDFEVMGRKYIASLLCSIEADLKNYGWKIVRTNCYCPDCKVLYTHKIVGGK